MTDKTQLLPVTPADRDTAWPFADFHCLPDRQMTERWYAGYYDSLPQGAPIRAFALHRLSSRFPGDGERDVLHEAADHLERYAAFIRTVKADELEMHPYLPALEDTIAELRAALTPTTPENPS